MGVNMKYYSLIDIKYEKNHKIVTYKKILELFIEISKFLKATKLDFLAVLDTYFDEKGYHKTRLAHEYKKNIETRIKQIEDNYNLYGFGFQTNDLRFIFTWNKEKDILHISIASNELIKEEIIKKINEFIQDKLLVKCFYEIDCLNKEYLYYS